MMDKMDKRLICVHCGGRIIKNDPPFDWPYCHLGKVLTYRCDSKLRSQSGWEQANKAEPFNFNTYLKQVEQLNK